MTSFEERHHRGQFFRIFLGKSWYRGCLSFCLYIQGHCHGVYKKCHVFLRLWKNMLGCGNSCKLDGIRDISKFKTKTKPTKFSVSLWGDCLTDYFEQILLYALYLA